MRCFLISSSFLLPSVLGSNIFWIKQLCSQSHKANCFSKTRFNIMGTRRTAETLKIKIIIVLNYNLGLPERRTSYCNRKIFLIYLLLG
jgi:hypothetical protein